jgi:hypothetical protein
VLTLTWSHRLLRGAAAMGAGLLLLAGAAALRAVAGGTLKVDQVPIAPLPGALVSTLAVAGLVAIVAGYLFPVAGGWPGAAQHEDVRDGPRAPATWGRLALLAAALHLLGALVLPFTSNDTFNNLRYGHLEAHRGVRAATASGPQLLADPLTAYVGDTWKTTPCLYGPVAIGHFRMVSWLGGERVAVALAAYKLSMLAISAAWAILCLYAARALDRGQRGMRVFWLLACNPLWLYEIPGQGHNDGLMTVLMLAALLAWRRERTSWASLLLAVASAVKFAAVLPFALTVAWTVWRGTGDLRRRVWHGALQTLVFAGTLALCYAPAWEGWQTITYPASYLATPRLTASLLAVASWWGASWGPQASVAAAAWTLRAFAAVCAGLAVYWVAGWRNGARDWSVPWDTALRVMLVIQLLVRGFFVAWQLTWMLPLMPAVRGDGWWMVVVTFTCLGVLQYVLDFVVPAGAAAVRPFFLVVPPALMLFRMVKR